MRSIPENYLTNIFKYVQCSEVPYMLKTKTKLVKSIKHFIAITGFLIKGELQGDWGAVHPNNLEN